MTKTWLGIVVTFVYCLALTGCESEANKNAEKKPGGKEEHAHAHPHEGPHGGHLIEFGKEEYHGELVHDDAKKSVSLYLLDSKAKDPVAVKDAELTLNLVVDGKPQQATLAAAPQPGDKEGESSRSTTTDEAVFEAIENEKTTGRVNVTIGGKEFTGEIEEHEHDHK